MVLILVALPVWIGAQVAFIEVATPGEMDAARKKASDQQLMLFVDIYASWCGPCKKMDREVYTNADVANFMNDNFVSVRLDGESDFGRKFANDQQLEGYPSMFILSRDGEPVSKVVGFTPADELVKSLKGKLEGYRAVRKYRTLYSRGTLEDEDFALYIAAVRNMGNQDEAEKLAAEYTERIVGPRLSDNDIRVVAFYMDLEDRWWSEFVSDQDRIRRVLGGDYMLAMEKIYNNTLVRAVEEEDVALISKMANELAPMAAEESNTWDLHALPFIQFYYYTSQYDALISYVDKRFASDRKDDHRWLYGAASQITDMDQQYQTKILLEKELQWFEQCIELEEQFDYYFYHGMVLFFLNRQEEARHSFLKAELLAGTGEQKQMIGQVLGFLNSQ